MEVPDAAIDAPVAVINPHETGMGPQDVEPPVALSPAEVLMIRMLNDIDGSITIDSSNPRCVVLSKIDAPDVTGCISMAYTEGGNNVHVHFPKELVHPFLTFSWTGRVALPFGRSLISLNEREFTVNFQVNAARYNRSRADILGLFKFVLDLHETHILGLGDFAGELNA